MKRLKYLVKGNLTGLEVRQWRQLRQENKLVLIIWIFQLPYFSYSYPIVTAYSFGGLYFIVLIYYPFENSRFIIVFLKLPSLKQYMLFLVFIRSACIFFAHLFLHDFNFCTTNPQIIYLYLRNTIYFEISSPPKIELQNCLVNKYVMTELRWAAGRDVNDVSELSYCTRCRFTLFFIFLIYPAWTSMAFF